MPSNQGKCFTWTCHAMNKEHGVHKDFIQYSIYGIEVCPTTGKQHLQGYTQMKQKATIKWYKENVCDKCHVEISKGNDEQNRKYSSKDGNYFEFGVRQRQGKRNDLICVTESLVSGTPLIQVVREKPDTYIRNYRGIKDALCALVPPQERNVTVYTEGRLGYESPVGDVYYYDCSEGYKPYPYHGQENMYVYNYTTTDNFMYNIVSGNAMCIGDVPCRVSKVFHR